MYYKNLFIKRIQLLVNDSISKETGKLNNELNSANNEIKRLKSIIDLNEDTSRNNKTNTKKSPRKRASEIAKQELTIVHKDKEISKLINENELLFKDLNDLKEYNDVLEQKMKEYMKLISNVKLDILSTKEAVILKSETLEESYQRILQENRELKEQINKMSNSEELNKLKDEFTEEKLKWKEREEELLIEIKLKSVENESLDKSSDEIVKLNLNAIEAIKKEQVKINVENIELSKMTQELTIMMENEMSKSRIENESMTIKKNELYKEEILIDYKQIINEITEEKNSILSSNLNYIKQMQKISEDFQNQKNETIVYSECIIIQNNRIKSLQNVITECEELMNVLYNQINQTKNTNTELNVTNNQIKSQLKEEKYINSQLQEQLTSSLIDISKLKENVEPNFHTNSSISNYFSPDLNQNKNYKLKQDKFTTHDMNGDTIEDEIKFLDSQSFELDESLLNNVKNNFDI